MATPENRMHKLIIRGALISFGLAFLANRAGLIKIGDSQEAVETPENPPAQTLDSRNYEIGVASENITHALHWIAFQRNPKFDTAIADISRIQGELTELDKYFYISDLDPSSIDQKYADIAYRSTGTNGSVIMIFSKELFIDRAFDSAAAGRDLLKAWKKMNLAINDPRIHAINADIDRELDQEASRLVDAELARR
ncbi:hypothetical protein HY382_01090 [Candidatus Curtissbacteria bacterium]|nr:hypothetical protein [Candidatus Curtissbacteria bacterium]